MLGAPTIRRQPVARDENGSILVAVMVIMIMLAVGATLSTRTIANLGSVTHAQNFSSALGSADAGVSDALFQLDQFSSSNPAPSGGEFCVSPSSNCTNHSIPGVPGVQYKAVQASPTKWVIQSLGTTHNVTHGAETTVFRSSLYPFALFGNNGLDFTGAASGGFRSYDSSSISSSTNPNSSGAVSIGSNGPINCSGGLGSNVTAVYYTGGGGISGSCGTPTPSTSIYPLPMPTAPSSNSGCPNGGLLGSGQSPSYPIIPAGTYLCTGTISISGMLTVTGTVQLYDIWSNPAASQGATAVGITAGSSVNIPASPSLPVASAFQILSNTQGNVGDSNGQGFTFGGVIYAPGAYLTANGCKSVYYGSFTLNTFTCHGGPNLTINYDTELSKLYSSWSVSNYTEVPSSSITIP